MNLKTAVKALIPESIFQRMRPWWERYKEHLFSNQGTTQITIGDYQLEVPASHPLKALIQDAPCRDVGIGIIARHAGEKYPDQAIIDIGANVGDSAALIASHCTNDLILIEASDYYFPFLEKNTAHYRNHITLEKTLLSDGGAVTGQLQHWGGTAFFSEGEGSQCIQTRRLMSITPRDVCFIKSDTDGFDFKILLDSLEWLAVQRPALLFEDQILTSEDISTANHLCDELAGIGYRHFIVWDDAGRLILTTNTVETLHQLHRYLYNIRHSSRSHLISNYDVACFHTDDRDLFEKVCSTYPK